MCFGSKMKLSPYKLAGVCYPIYSATLAPYVFIEAY